MRPPGPRNPTQPLTPTRRGHLGGTTRVGPVASSGDKQPAGRSPSILDSATAAKLVPRATTRCSSSAFAALQDHGPCLPRKPGPLGLSLSAVPPAASIRAITCRARPRAGSSYGHRPRRPGNVLEEQIVVGDQRSRIGGRRDTARSSSPKPRSRPSTDGRPYCRPGPADRGRSPASAAAARPPSKTCRRTAEPEAQVPLPTARFQDPASHPPLPTVRNSLAQPHPSNEPSPPTPHLTHHQPTALEIRPLTSKSSEELLERVAHTGCAKRRVAFGLRCGLDGRSCDPASPCSRRRFTHLPEHAREMPISAATWAMGRVWHRFTSRLRPSTLRGACAWGTRRPLEVGRRQARHLSCAPAALRPFSPAVRRGYGSRQDRLRGRSARTPRHEARAGS